MIHPRTVAAWLMAMVLMLMIALAEHAHAEEDVAKEDSPAAQAFRDAWWQETGAGALDKALEGYRAAVAAKGSEGVRAKALYRMGLVLQRMGRMDEALAAMKRLATDFPGEGALLARAKQRLEEWTAVDLRQQFPEWYKRYQYSPEFQAKIVDLVLKLGAPKSDDQRAARQELLTIGEPAIPALEQHAGSANKTLSRYVMEILVDLGRLPPPATAFGNTTWYRDYGFWRLLAEADEATRAGYAKAAAENKEQHWLARWVSATLAGPDAVLAELRSDDAASGSMLNSVLAPWFAKGGASAAMMGAFRAMVVDATVPPNARETLANKLLPAFDYDSGKPHPFGLTPEEVVRWADSDQEAVRRVAWGAMGSAQVHAQAALDAVSAYVLEQRLRDKDRTAASNAILGILRMRDSLDGTDQAVEALKKLFTDGGMQNVSTNAMRDWGANRPGSPAVPARAFAKAVGQVRGKNAGQLVYAYYGHREALDAAEVQAQLLDWAENAADGEVRRKALARAAQDAGDDLMAVTRPITLDSATAALVQDFFHGLTRSNLQSLPWDAESAARLVEAAKRYLDRSTGKGKSSFTHSGIRVQVLMPYQHAAVHPMMRLLHEGPHAMVFFEAAVRFPERFDGDFWFLLGDEWKQAPANRELVLASLEKGWGSWSPEQREAGLDALLRKTTVLIDDEATETLLRRMLRSEGNTAEARAILLEYVAELTLDDVRGSFDLSTAEGVDQAARLLLRLPATRAVYDAFVPALRPAGPEYAYLYGRFWNHADENLVRDLISRLLAHEIEDANEHGMGLLQRRAKAEDLPIWIKALTHRSAGVRKTAAERLGRLYNADAIQALAKAVDDPDPDVRDAVLASLAKIEKTEKEKERWREFAKKGR